MPNIEYTPLCAHCGREQDRHSLNGHCFFLLPQETMHLSEAPTSYEPVTTAMTEEVASA